MALFLKPEKSNLPAEKFSAIRQRQRVVEHDEGVFVVVQVLAVVIAVTVAVVVDRSEKVMVSHF